MMTKNVCAPKLVTKTLLVIGGLNWGLVGIGYFMGTNLNVVNLVVGAIPNAEAIVYILVGVAAVLSFFHCKCKKCQGCSCTDNACTHCNVDAPKM